MYVKVSNGAVEQYPYTLGNLRRDNPNTSFPKRPSNETLAAWGVHAVEYKPQPDHDGRTQRLEQNAQPIMEGDKWVIGWTVAAKTAEEVQDYDDSAARSVRSQRDNLLAFTDWRVIKAQETGVAMEQVWVDYRQALRDITSHVNFPHLKEADWPVKP